MKIIEKNIPSGLLKKGYWLKVSPYFTFIITLDIIEGSCVEATAIQINTDNLEIDTSELKNGEEVFFFSMYGLVDKARYLGEIFFPFF